MRGQSSAIVHVMIAGKVEEMGERGGGGLLWRWFVFFPAVLAGEDDQEQRRFSSALVLEGNINFISNC